MVPAVAGLKRQGANNGACVAFLISTPESGVDSIALTYSLLDPILTVIRPLVAFVTGTVAGILENMLGKSYTEEPIPPLADCDGPEECGAETLAASGDGPGGGRIRGALSFAFLELPEDLGKWFLLGVLLAGALAYLLPDSLLEGPAGSGILAYLGMLVISLPMYVCATLSTPLAAALVMKGLSPGAALVFLMAGPATNAATITMLGGIFGRRTLGIYLASIVGCTLGFAFLTDLLYSSLGISAKAVVGTGATEFMPPWLEIGAAVVLAILCFRGLVVGLRDWMHLREQVGPTGVSNGHESPGECSCTGAAEPGGT